MAVKLPSWLRRTLAFLLLAGIVAFALAWREWDASGLDRRVRELAEWRNVRIEGQPFGYSPLRGLLLRETRVRLPLDNGAAILKVPRGRVRLDPWQLFEVKCREIYAEGLDIDFFLGPAKERKRQLSSPDRNYLDLDPKRPKFQPERVTFENSTLVLREIGKASVLFALKDLTATLEDLRLSSFSRNPFEALIGSGRIEAGQLLFRSTGYSNMAGEFRLIDGVFLFKDLAFDAPVGEFLLTSAELDLASGAPALKAALSADVKDARLLGPDLLADFKEPLRGRLRCDLGGDLANLAGDCKLALKVDGMEVGRLPWIQKISRLVLARRRPILAKGEWVLPFKIQDSTYELQDAWLETDGLSFRLNGRVSESGVALAADTLIPRKEIQPGVFPARVLAELAAGPARIRFPFLVTGTLTRPEARIRQGRENGGLSSSAFSEVNAFLQFRAALEEGPGSLLP